MCHPRVMLGMCHPRVMLGMVRVYTTWVCTGIHHPGYVAPYPPWVYLTQLYIPCRTRHCSRCDWVCREDTLGSTFGIIREKRSFCANRASSLLRNVTVLRAGSLRLSRKNNRKDWIAGGETSVKPLCNGHVAHSGVSNSTSASRTSAGRCNTFLHFLHFWQEVGAREVSLRIILTFSTRE